MNIISRQLISIALEVLQGAFFTNLKVVVKYSINGAAKEETLQEEKIVELPHYYGVNGVKITDIRSIILKSAFYFTYNKYAKIISEGESFFAKHDNFKIEINNSTNQIDDYIGKVTFSHSVTPASNYDYFYFEVYETTKAVSRALQYLKTKIIWLKGSKNLQKTIENIFTNSLNKYKTTNIKFNSNVQNHTVENIYALDKEAPNIIQLEASTTILYKDSERPISLYTTVQESKIRNKQSLNLSIKFKRNYDFFDCGNVTIDNVYDFLNDPAAQKQLSDKIQKMVDDNIYQAAEKFYFPKRNNNITFL